MSLPYIIATVAVSSIPVAIAYQIVQNNVKTIEANLQRKSGKAYIKVEFRKRKRLDLVGEDNEFEAVIKPDSPCDPYTMAKYLKTVLADELQSPEYPQAQVNVSADFSKRRISHENGKDKAPLEFKSGTTYTVNVKNDQKTGKYPVIYCPGVQVNTGEPFFNTWFTSPTLIANKLSTTISWTETYSVSLSQLIVKDGVTVSTSIVQTASLGEQVIFSLKGGIPSNTPPTPISSKNIIQVYLESGYDYEKWAVGFGISDPSGTNNPVMVVQGDAGTYYNFKPTPSYVIALASQNDTNKLVKLSEVTDCVPIQFSGSTTTVDIEHQVNGNWITTYPSAAALASKGKITQSPKVALQLVKRTVTSTTTVEEYA